MLSHEWHELERLSNRIIDLRERSHAARRCNNVGLLHAIKKDIDAAARQREKLVLHISARLRSIAA